MADGLKLDLDIIGTTGLKQQGGVIFEEFSRKLRGSFAASTYREMADNSSVIGAIRNLIKSLVRQTEWRIEPADNSPEAKEWADFAQSALDDMSMTFEDFLSEALSMLDFGWAYFEIVYKVRRGKTDDPRTRSTFDDGKIGWRKFAIRAQETLDHWELDPTDGGIRGLWQQDQFTGGGTVFIPIEKSLLFRTETTKGNPEGRSLFRNAVVDHFLLKRIQEIEAIGIERDMTGLLVMEVPIEVLQTNASVEARALRTSFEKMLGSLKRDEREFAMVPPEVDPEGKPTGYKLKLLSSGGTRQINTNEVKNYYRFAILQSVMAQFLQLGASSVGSFALADSQTNLFAVALGTIMDTMASTFTRFGIDRLMELNGVPDELWPKMVHGDLETPDLGQIASYVQALSATNMLPQDVDPMRRKLLEIAGLPQGEEEVIEQRRRTPRLLPRNPRVTYGIE